MLTCFLHVFRPLDREYKSVYKFVVVATDGGRYDAKTTSVPVQITLTDVNDNRPVFAEYPFLGNVPIGSQPGRNIMQVKATDADLGLNGEIVYSFLQEQEKPKFRIHPSSGIVTATSSLAQDNGKVFHLEVLAKDKGNPPQSAVGLIELRVGEVPKQTPFLKFQNDESLDVVVTENSPSGTEIIQVTAVRSDGRRQHISYSIGSGNDYDTFSIDEDSGLVRVNDPKRLDAELLNNVITVGNDVGRIIRRRSIEGQQAKEEPRDSATHTLILVARTVGPEPLVAYSKLVVRVSDVNDNPPIFTQMQYSATVLEGNTKGNFVVNVSRDSMFFFPLFASSNYNLNDFTTSVPCSFRYPPATLTRV